MQWFWEAHMREASASSFAVLPKRVTGSRLQAAFLCTLPGRSRGKGRLAIRQEWQTPLGPRRGSRKSMPVALVARCVSEARGPHGGSIEDVTPSGGSTPNDLAGGRRIGETSSTPSRYKNRKKPKGRPSRPPPPRSSVRG